MTPQPNFIIIICDDIGYGDLGCCGSTVHRTPHLDRMAAEGRRFTSYYGTGPVCTPSRASLLTGCYPRRISMQEDSEHRWVLIPQAKKGLNPQELTIAGMLKEKDYATACIGKWHLGDQPKFLPTRCGFDYYYGIPYSNDMGPNPALPHQPPLPMVRNETVIEASTEQSTLTSRYTKETIQFIRNNKDRPFFIYLGHNMPHVPVNPGDNFRGKSQNGLYGDAVEEIDWSAGKILDTLRKLGIDDHTFVMFTSDHGAQEGIGGSNAPFRGWKGTTLEGGMRVVCLMRWPEMIPMGTICDQLCSHLDILPTISGFARGRLPEDRIIDGKDISSLMTGEKHARSPHNVFYYYFRNQLQAVRSGKWKLHLSLNIEQTNWTKILAEGPGRPMKLVDLERDLQETTDVAAGYPEVVETLLKFAAEARSDLGDEDQPGKNQRPAGWVENPKPLIRI